MFEIYLHMFLYAGLAGVHLYLGFRDSRFRAALFTAAALYIGLAWLDLASRSERSAPAAHTTSGPAAPLDCAPPSGQQVGQEGQDDEGISR